MQLVPLLLLLGSSLCACRAPLSYPPRAADLRVAGDEPAATVAFDDGLRLRSADGRNELVVEGLFQAYARVTGGDREPASEFVLKRMRPELAGRFADSVLFRLEPKFSDDGVELEEAWVGTRLADERALLMVGRMKVPFNLEEVRSRRHIDFPYFSLVNQFAPAEDHGVFVNGETAGGGLEYGLSLSNGGADEEGDGKLLAARVMAHPYRDDPGSRLHALQLGVAATIEDSEAELGGDTIHNEAGQTVVELLPGVRLDGTRSRLGLEAAWYHGPQFVQAELLHQRQRMDLGGADETVDVTGGYLTLSRALTGEDKTFGGVTPSSDAGAWTLALRLAALSLDDDLGAYALPGAFTDDVRSVALGLNWVPNRHVIVRHSLVASFYGDQLSLDTGAADEELTFLVEAQLHF
jgi:phosphate-selective porin OprO/OprP